MPRKTWQQLAELAAGEQDPDKLRALIRELTGALDEQTKGITRQPPQQLSKRLLFVDDEEGIRATLPALLRQRGFDVRVAADVAEALSEMKTHDFDVLLSDLNIGQDGDGFAVIRAMRNAHPGCVAILLTGYPGFESSLQALHDEVDDYFLKPANLDSLVSTIERKLRTRLDREVRLRCAESPHRSHSHTRRYSPTAFPVLPAKDNWDRVAAHCKSSSSAKKGGRNPFGSFRQLRLPPEMKA